MRDGFHDGELAVQDRAGVRAQAARLGQGMLAAPNLSAGMSGFLADREFAVLTARGEDGLWTSPIHAAPGFLEATDRTLRVHATPMGPALNIADGEPVGLLAIDFAGRRRVRVNGTVIAVAADGFDVAVDQAFGNCPRYIEQRRLVHAEPPVGTRCAVERVERRSGRADHPLGHLLSGNGASAARRRRLAPRWAAGLRSRRR
jgi:hypothetical protein